MSASAGGATAAPEELGPAVGSESEGAQAAIVSVSGDRGTWEILHRELAKRYGGDYQIVVATGPQSWRPGCGTWWPRVCRWRWALAGAARRGPEGAEGLAPVPAPTPRA